MINTKLKKSLFLLTFISLSLLKGVVASANVSINVTADKNRVSLSETIRVQVTITGSGNIPSPTLPEFSAFAVYSSGRSQNYSFINGKMSSSITHTYVLSPKKVGKFTIGSFSVTVGGKTANSQPIPIEVVAAQSAAPSTPTTPQAQSQNAPGAFVTMKANKSKAYLNEEIILTFRFYYRISLLANPHYTAPAYTGFIHEDLPPPRNFMESVKGVQYRVTEIKSSLFPTKTGKIVIPPASLKISVNDVRSDRFSNDFFSSFFRSPGRQYLLKSDPVELNILPLPLKDKPAEFSGGVGELGLSVNLDKRKSAVGDPVTLTVSVIGSGNMKSLGDPKFPDFKGFRKYDTVSSLNVDKSQGHVRGSKVYNIILVPQASGIQRIDPITFDYFHLPSKKYRSVKTKPLQLEILPGEKESEPLSPLTFASPQIKKFGEDIRFIKLAWYPANHYSSIVTAPWFKVINFIPLLGLVGMGIFRWRSNLLEKDPKKRKFAKSYSLAIKELNVAKQSIKKNRSEDAQKTILLALQTYIANKLYIQPTGLTLKEADENLKRLKVSNGVLENLRRTWSDLDLMRYSPAGYDSQDLERLLEETRRLILSLDKELKSFKPGSNVMKSLIALFLCLGLLGIGHSRSIPPAMTEAEQNYQNGNFRIAFERYKVFEDPNQRNFFLEYNLGNAAYKLNRKGVAISHWIRAFKMNPRDEDVRYNLAIATLQVGDPFFPDFVFMRWVKSFVTYFNLNEISVFWLIILWGASFYWMWLLLRRETFWNRWSVVALCSVLFIGSLWLYRYQDEHIKVHAVVTQQSVEVRSGPGAQFGVGFMVPEGRRVTILKQIPGSDWIEVGVSQEGIKGWVQSSSITKI